jgi:hypothetical protein
MTRLGRLLTTLACRCGHRHWQLDILRRTYTPRPKIAWLLTCRCCGRRTRKTLRDDLAGGGIA